MEPNVGDNLPNRPNIRARNSVFDAIKDQWWLSKWLQLHSFILYLKSLCRPIQKEDMFNLKEDYWPETLYLLYGRYKTVYPYFTASRIVREIIKRDMILACILAVIDSALGFAGPIFLKYILKFLNSSTITPTEKQSAYTLATLWVVFYLVKIFVREYWTRLAYLAALKVEVLMEGQMYRKIMRMSSTYRKYNNPGTFYANWFVDVGVITQCITSFPNIAGAPATFAFAVIFVCFEVGPSGLMLLAAVLVAIGLQMLINMKMAQVYGCKLKHYDNRLAENVHMYNNFKEIKCMAWERILLDENIRLRSSENSFNRTYYILGQIFLFITKFTPYIVILVLLMSQYYSDDQFRNNTVIYTIIGYMGVIAPALVDLPNTIVKTFQYSDVFRRFQNLLGADEIKKIRSFYMPNGQLDLDHLILGVSTRRSINRIIVQESLFVKKSHQLKKYIKSLPIEVRLYHSLDFMSEEETQKFCMYLKCLQVPFKLSFSKGDRVVLLGPKSGSGKTSFIKSLLGSMSIESGSIKHGGKIGYVGLDNLFIDSSIRDNVVFGELFDLRRLKSAYQRSGLVKELPKFKDNDETKVDNSAYIFSPAQRNLICLARAIYYNCDILLLNNFFHEFQIDEAHSINLRLLHLLRDKLLIMSVYTTELLEPTDKVIILEDRVAVEYGTFGEMKSNPDSHIHNYRVKDHQLQHYENIAIEIKAKSPETLRIPVSLTSLGSSVSIREHYHMNEIKLIESSENLINKTQTEIPCLPPTPVNLPRPGSVQLKYILMLFKKGGFEYLYTFLIITAAAGVTTFSTWLIGLLNKQPFGLSEGSVITLYASLDLINGILLLVYGIFMPRVVTHIIESINNRLNQNIIHTSLEGLQDFNGINLIFWLGIDGQNFYAIIDCITGLFFASVSLISTVVILGMVSYQIWIVLAVVSVYTVLIYAGFRRAYQETFATGGSIKRYYFRSLNDYVNGVDSIQFYDKVEWFRARVFDGIYVFSVIWKCNMQFIIHSFNILSGFSTMAMMISILFLAISHKNNTLDPNLIFVNVAVSATPKLMNSLFSMFANLSNMVRQINTFMKVPLECLNGRDQKQYSQPLKPENWPVDGHIQFRKVTYERRQRVTPLIDNLSLTIQSGQVIGIYGCLDNDVYILFYLLNGFLRPQTNNGRDAGQVLISGVDTTTIGQIYITETVVMIDAVPGIYSGTIRYNMDPFNRFKDDEITEALAKVKFWDDLYEQEEKDRMLLDPSFGTLDFILQERGAQLTTKSAQKLSIARVILKKPKVLILDRALSRIDIQYSDSFYDMVVSTFKETTILYLTAKLEVLLRCDRVLCFQKGNICEEGKAQELALNPNTRLHRMLQISADKSSEPGSPLMSQQ